MSYILDALRRAEAEREQEKASVPGVHSAVLSDRPLPPVATRSASRAPLAWALGLIAIALVGVGAWWLGRSATPVAPSPAAAPVPMPAVTAPVPAAPNPVVPMAPPPAPVPTARAPAPAPVLVPPSNPPAPPAAVSPAPVPPPPAAALPTYRELPEATRRQLSPLTVGGAMHSPDPASRMLILNGQVVRQGDTVAPGLVLEEIQPRAAVLVFQGQRFTLPY
jgi:general secretion pathway protein B